MSELKHTGPEQKFLFDRLPSEVKLRQAPLPPTPIKEEPSDTLS